MAVSGHNLFISGQDPLVVKILTALGISPEGVVEFRLHAAAKSIVTVWVERLVDQKQIGELYHLIKEENIKAERLRPSPNSDIQSYSVKEWVLTEKKTTR
jgi:hypothetical protein